MRYQITILLIVLFGLELNAQFKAGPYAPPAGQNNSTAIHKDSTVLVEWANSSTIVRGNQDISNVASGLTTVGTVNSATDKAGLNGVVSLGDGGSATLTFNGLITNGQGPDFAVFENSFDDSFLELAFVEVSSDGINFFRFDATSLTDTDTQTGTFGNTNATNLYNLAGKYRAQYGTPFDLDELSGTPGLNINAISHVKIIDVIGNISTPIYTSYDSQNNPINDPWPTPFPSGGFDLDAVGAINFIPTSVREEGDGLINLSYYPNPASNYLYFDFEEKNNYKYLLINISGTEIENGLLKDKLNVQNLNSGIYFIHITFNDKHIVRKFIKN